MPLDSQQLQPAWLNAQCPREGRYVIGPLLGRGGMGDVHEAWDLVLCRAVALKELKVIEPAALIRFLHEAQVHARVVHPNICRLYDVDHYEGGLRVAMQLVHGSNLEQARGELSIPEAVAILAQVAQAVHVVHRLNLIHRDLKPSNILLERNGEGAWTPYVCDFGLAMALDESALTHTHGVLGTPAYMAPEQLLGDRQRISPATDVYALGGTLYVTLTGRPPGVPSRRGEPALDPALPRDLRAIIAKCLEADPQLRYATASALAEDLWRFQQGVPVQASRRRSLMALGRTGLKRSKSWLLVLTGAGLTTGYWMAHQAFTRTADRRQMALSQQFLLEADDQAREFQQELMLPLHDLQPSYARIRAQMERDALQIRAMAPQWRAQGHYALGSASFLVRDFAVAKTEMEQAWAGGLQVPDVAERLALADIAVAREAEEEAQFDSQRAATGKAATSPAPGPNPSGPAAVLAYLDKDYLKGAINSHAAFLAAPWNWRAAALESACLGELARQEQDAGSLATARTRYQEAVAAARAGLATGQSDPGLYHVYFQAARGLVSLGLEWGELPAGLLVELQAASTRALSLDPADPDLQDDWLAFHWLRARQLQQLGQDPGPELEAARAFMTTWVREPLSPRLQADRMLIYWQLAEREFLRTGDAGPALAEALKTSGHTPFYYRDYLWEVLNFKARVDAARGVDPRPVLDAALGQLQPLQQGTPWSLKETVAASWLIRAQWESAHGLDPSASTLKARALAESARSQNPDSASACALEGLALVQELKASPRERPRLLPLARESLSQALARSPRGLNQTLLASALREAGRSN